MTISVAKARQSPPSADEQASAVRRSIWRELGPLKERLLADSREEFWTRAQGKSLS